MKSINFISKMMNWIKKDQVKHLPSIISGKWTDNGPITDRQRTDHSFIAFHALRYVAATALLLCLGVGQMWGADISNYAHGWEDNSTSAYTNSNATLSISSEARTGTKSMQTYYNGTGDRRIETTATFAVTTSQTMYAIGYAKLPSGDATAQSTSTLAYLDCYLGGGSTYTSVQLTTSWQRMTAYKKPGSNQTGKTLRIQRKHANKGNVLFDDIIVYVSTDSKIDLKKPDSASSASASTSSISWTEGTDASDSDNGATGVQKTLIFRRSSGSLDDLTLNDQGIYSLTSSEGPSTDQSEHWTLVAVINTGTESHSGTFSAGDRYAIVHRDLAYNYSTPTYVTVAGGACTAPNHVDISGNWDYFGGETISLSAQAYSSAGTGSPIAEGNITGYQWKHNGVNIAGATSKTFTKTATGPTDGGNYSCVVSTGATCSTESSPYGTKVYALEFYTGGTTDYNFTRVGTSKVGIVDVTLPASTQREFKIYAGHTGGDGQYYGNGDGTYPIKNDISEWDFEDGKSNCKINPGLGGTFRFTIDYTANGGKPKVSVTYPKKAIYLTPNSDWKSSSAKFAYYYFNANTNGWTDFLTAYACGDGVYVGEVPVWDGVKIDAVRFNSTKASTGNWDDKWNQTSDITVESGKNMVTITGWDESQTYTAYAEPTYTITFAGNGSTSGSMSSITSIACDADQALTANVFEKTGYTFANWTADVDVKVSGATVTTGNAIANSATIQNVRSNIALTAQWTPKNYDLTWNLGGGTTTSAGTGIASGVSSNTTSSVAYGTSLTAPTVTKTGYNFSAWSPSVASTMPAAATTYTATWTAKTTSITINANTANHGSTTPGSVTATYGSALPSFTAAAGVSGWNLTGYFTEATSGTKVINANGTLVASTDYADGSGKWKYETATLTLYPQYEEEAPAGDEVTATWPMVSGSSLTLVGSADHASVSPSNAVKAGTNISDLTEVVDASFTDYTGKMAKVTASGTIGEGGSVTNDHYLKYTLTVASGYTFTPTGFSAMVARYATDNAYAQVVLKQGSTTIKATEASKPNRSGKSVAKTVYSAEFDDASTYSAGTAIDLYIYFGGGMASGKNFGVVAVSITGTYESASCTTPTTAFANGAYTVGGSALDLSTLISSKQGSGAITYTVKNANGTGATIAGTSFTATSAGTATVTATQAANGGYCEKVMDATITVSAAPAGTTYYLVTSTAQLNTTDTYVIMDDGKAAMMGVASGSNQYLNAITSGFTVAADKSTVTVTSSDVNTLTLKSESDAWNLFGKDSHYITTNSTVSSNLYGNATSGSGTDDFVFSFADGKVTIKRNTSTNFHIYYSSGTGFNQSETATNIRLYTSNSTPVYTVTYDLNGGTGTVPTNRPEKSGTEITLASSAGLTKDGYTFDGWLCSVNSTKYAAGASYTMTAANTTFTAQWEAVSGYTVTYKYNGATSGATPTSATGASVTLPTPTRTGYELDGWYTTAGEKVGNGGETYGPEANITLYARWQVACDGSGTDSSVDDVAATGYTTYKEKGGSNVVFTAAPSIGFKYKDADGNIVNNSTTAVVRNNAYKCQISSDSGNKGSIKTNNTFSNVDSISFYFAASDKGGCKIAVWCSTDDFSADSTSLLSATTYADNNSEFKLKTLAIPSGKKASALRFKFRFTVTSSGKTSYIDSLKIYSSTASSGTCYHVYYHGNGAESGFVSDTTSYSDGAKATVLSYNDSRYPLTREDYEFRGWATSAGGSAAYSDGQKITIDGADVHLYAVWAAETDALVTWTMKTNTGDWTATATSTTDGTNIGSIATARTAGGTGNYEGATAKVTMADAEVTGSAAPSNSANFTFTIKSSTKQVEINKFDCQVFNVSSGSRTYKAQISDAAGNVYNSTNTVPVSASATLTDASFVFGSGKILRGDVTIRIYAWKTSGSPTDFRMGPDVKFYGTVEDYECATPSAPTISGSSEYAVGQTITLAASHDGENYDNLTTYTWYRGADWATASAASPVQDADTGAEGYTLTKTAEAADDDLFWCKVSNGTCEAHNATGYNVNVYAANSITWHLNDGNWGAVEHKDSYTRFDDDYTLPIPSRDGYVFAGWYEASDFSGVPAVILESGSIGDKEYWAKWGTEVTVSWTVTKVDSKLYRGGGGYSVTAVINQADWDDYGDKDDLVLTATEGVTLKNVVKSINGDGKAQVFADFDITTGLAEDATSITFTLEVPAAEPYGPKVAEHDEDLTSCAGSKEIRFLSSNKNDAGDNFADMSTSSNTTQYVGNGLAKLIATGSSGLNDGDKKIGYRADRLNVVFKLNAAVALDVYFNAGSTGKSIALYSFSSTKALTDIGTSDYSTKSVVSSGVTVAGASFESGSHTTTAGAASLSTGVVNITTSGGVKVSYSSLAAGYYVLIGGSDGYLYGFDVSGGGVTPTLTWDDGDEDIATTGVSKNTSDDGFVYTASQDKNSLGAITYSSNNTAVATVNTSTGEVHLEGAAGNATITATIAASGCFDESSISYTITVVDDCDDVAGTITTEDLGCSGIKMTITGHTAAAGVSYQWYKDDAIIVGATSENYTATEAGSYYVIVTNSGDRHCAKRSRNTVTVEAQAAATATKIVDSWYVKNGRRTPDVELVQTTNAESFTVTNKGTSAVIWNSDSTVTTGFGGCGFHLGENGIIYLNGTKDNGDAPSGLTGATDVTLTITAIGCGGNQSKDITIHCQAATTRPSIAFVVDGTKGGAWDAVTSGHASGTDLYDYLNYNESTNATGAFDLTERNVYSTTDEKAIREHYSQFDAILITDDPSTDTKDGGKPSKSYVNAFGTMIDVRPILTMEAYVSKWSNWSAKGIAGNPQSPNPRQYEIRLECKDHEIYKAGLPEPEDGTNVWEEVIGGETFRHVILVDSTKGIYNGVAYNVETAGDKKPALQGFTGEAAGSLLGLGRISEGTLQAAIERQEEPAARLLVMGINAKALHETSALTPEGKIILRNILTYLLKTNMEEVDDCSNYFTGATSTDWNTASNWSKGNLPSSEAKVRILAPCVISGSQPHVTQVAIVNSGKSSIRETATGSPDCNGSLTINANGALIVEGEVLAAEAPHFAHNDLMPTTVEDLIINTNGSGQAALIFDNDAGDTKATVNLYSLGRKIESSYQFQYMAVPMNYIDVNPAFAGSGIYTYVWKEASGWERRAYYAGLSAFEGVGITTTSTSVGNYTLQGALTSTSEKEITLTKASTGQNIVGNSWLAPINIASLRTALEDDANIVDKTVYIYCTGNDGATVSSGTTETPGQWLAIPIEAAAWGEWTGLKVIPAMQAFCIKANAETTLTLNYKDHVRSAATTQLNQKLRAPKRRTEAESEGIDLIRIRVADSRTHTDLYLFEGEQFGEEFDNGWEAKYMSGDGRSAKLYAETEIGQMAVAALPELEGTILGFAPGKEAEYTFTFSGPNKEYYLNDLKLKKSALISEDESYLFTFEDGDTNRFYISKTRIDAPAIATGVGDVNGEAQKPHKILYNDKLYILYNGRVYDATGKMVK